MSDRTQVSLTIYDCPLDKARPVLEALIGVEAYDTFEEISWAEGIPADRLILNEPYTAHEMVVGHAGDLATELAELGVTFELFEEPKYEWDGDCYLNLVGVGGLNLPCNAEGTTHLDCHELFKFIDEAVNVMCEAGTAVAFNTLVDKLEAVTGRKVQDALRELRSRDRAEIVFSDPVPVQR
jgi:hypothetical protein